MTTAWIFPGQGSQGAGMGRALYEQFDSARQLLDQADQAMGFPLTRLLFDGPPEDLQLTVNAQPAIMAVSLAALAAFAEACQAGGIVAPAPAFVAGHSVGELAAVVASGAASPAVGLRLVRERARLMQEAGESRPGSMVAVLGLPREPVEQACATARGRVPGSYVSVANHNAPTQVTIAGDPDGLAQAVRLCQQAGARRCVPLAVSAAFHSPAMSGAEAPFAQAVQSATITDATVPLVANVSAQSIHTADQIKDELSRQLTRSVLWADSVAFMVASGVTRFVEFGHGQVLTNLIQRLGGGVESLAVGDPAAVAQAVDWARE